MGVCYRVEAVEEVIGDDALEDANEATTTRRHVGGVSAQRLLFGTGAGFVRL